ncbi:hypothetical protein V6N13_051521 [Hibiscus sabdariffa]
MSKTLERIDLLEQLVEDFAQLPPKAQKSRDNFPGLRIAYTGNATRLWIVELQTKALQCDSKQCRNRKLHIPPCSRLAVSPKSHPPYPSVLSCGANEQRADTKISDLHFPFTVHQ